MLQATPEQARKAYRPPEMAGRPNFTQYTREDDVMRQPGTVAAMLLAVAIIVGLGFMYLGTTYGTQRVLQTDDPAVRAPSPAVY